jgi:hypothetical protein
MNRSEWALALIHPHFSSTYTLVHVQQCEWSEYHLQGMKHPLAQQGEPGSPESQTLQKFELIYASLNDSVAMRQRQTRKNSRFISLDAADHSLEFTDLAVSHFLQPGVQSFAFSTTKHAHEIRDQFIYHIGSWTGLANGCKFYLLCLVQIRTIADKQPDRLVGGKLLERSLWKCLRMFSPTLR